MGPKAKFDKAGVKLESPASVVKRLPMKWASTKEPILSADAFYFVYEEERTVLYLGYLDPLITVGPQDSLPEEIPITPLGRFLLTPKAFLRLKSQVDEVYDGMKAKGIFDG